MNNKIVIGTVKEVTNTEVVIQEESYRRIYFDYLIIASGSRYDLIKNAQSNVIEANNSEKIMNVPLITSEKITIIGRYIFFHFVFI